MNNGRHPNNYTNCKLTVVQVQDIRLRADAGIEPLNRIANNYGIARETVQRIKSRRTWTNVPYQDNYDELLVKMRGIQIGEYPMRSLRPNAKLTRLDVVEILSSPNSSAKELADKYGVGVETIRRTRRGESHGKVCPQQSAPSMGDIQASAERVRERVMKQDEGGNWIMKSLAELNAQDEGEMNDWLVRADRKISESDYIPEAEWTEFERKVAAFGGRPQYSSRERKG